MLSAVYGFKIKSRLFDGIDSIVEDWIVDQMHIVRGSQLWGIDIYTDDFDLVAVLMQASYYLPTASPPLSAIQELRAIIWCYLCKIKGGGTIDLEPYLTHSSTMEPILAPMAVERTTTTRAATSVGLVAALEEEQADQIDLSCFSGNLRHDDRDNARDCWKLSDGNNFRVRSKHFCYDKTKIPAGKHLMDLVAVDWFKDTKRIDHVARRQGCAAQVASEKGLFSLIFNLQIDVDIGSSTVANGVLGLVIGVITTLVVDMAFLVQANTTDELPERLIGAVHVSHIELKSAVVPKLEPEIS
ncbi:protein ENHANCED DISEASE RESISTANCE 2-like [Citrus sinensis]|uniref:Protein ENHANCED DISEASE RESISTANCE 2-like n=1 Tax=Citrus sinensis TaxID=2711 RepID=A0ACB8KF42_CITSI|nr:protein ENHANCED DISEASE RESISTANCE 2-like [Citrus sinensis]